MAGIPRPDLAALGLDTFDPQVFSALVLVAAVAVWALLHMVVRSPFGAMLVAIHRNESRVRALGCPVQRYKLAAFVLAGAIGGFAGSLIAQHSGFVSPHLGFWTVSGEVLIMVIIGGHGQPRRRGARRGGDGAAAPRAVPRRVLGGNGPSRRARQLLAVRDGD